MKTRQITDYEIYYYFSAIEQYMLEMMDEKFFVDNMLNYKFYETLKRFVGHLYDENCYPIKCINKLKDLIKKICDKTYGEWFIKYQILYQFLEKDDWIDSNQYLTDAKNKYHGSLKEGLEKKTYSKEELEQELNQTFNYLDLILNEKLNTQKRDVFEQQNFITFVKTLLQEGPSIVQNGRYKKQITDCLNLIIKDNEKLKKQAQYLLYQIKTGVYNNLEEIFCYDYFVDLVKIEYIKKCFINPDIESLDSIFTKEQLYSNGFKEVVENLIDYISEINIDNAINISYEHYIKNRLFVYLSEYDSYIREDAKQHKDEIRWINEQKVKVNALTSNQIVSYIASDIYSCFMSKLDAINFGRGDVKTELSIQFYNDVQYLNSLLLTEDGFAKEKDGISKNKYILRSIYKYLYCLDEIYVDPTVYERTMDLINGNLKEDKSLVNKLRGNKIKKKLANYYEEKKYERV